MALPLAVAVADADDRAAAKANIAATEPAGGTAIGTWLDLARQLFTTTTAPSRHAILLTDGRNEHQQPHELAAAISACRGLFQCDCRGVGVDWEVDELRGIATALLGTVDIVADPQDLAAELEDFATRQGERGAWQDVSSALFSAARLTTDPERHDHRLRRAVDASVGGVAWVLRR